MDRLPFRITSALRLDAPQRARRFSDADRTATYQSTIMAVGEVADDTQNAMATEPSIEPVKPLEQHSCTVPNCAITRTFETTELLEIILGFLNTADVLNLRRICQKWNSVTRESPNLRLHYFVRPEWDRHAENFELLGLKLPGLVIKCGDEVDMGRWVQIRMSNRAAHLICPDAGRRRRPRARSIFEGLRGGLGSKSQQTTSAWPCPATSKSSIEPLLKYDELFVAQPPIVGMQAFVTKSAAAASSSEMLPQDQAEGTACAKLFCDAGITMGFLADTTASLLSSGDSEAVVFKAIVSFSTPSDRRTRRADRDFTYIS